MDRRIFLGHIAMLPIVVAAPKAVTQEERVQFDLSPEEAQALANVCSQVGGSPIRSQRRYIDKISSRLSWLGYRYQRGNTFGSREPWQNGVYFTDDSELRTVLPPGKDLGYQSRWQRSFNADGSLHLL